MPNSQAVSQAAVLCVPEVQSHDRKTSNPWTLVLKPKGRSVYEGRWRSCLYRPLKGCTAWDGSQTVCPVGFQYQSRFRVLLGLGRATLQHFQATWAGTA